MKDIYSGKLIGIVSFGMDMCADPNYPGVYARVAAERAWIRYYARI